MKVWVISSSFLGFVWPKLRVPYCKFTRIEIVPKSVCVDAINSSVIIVSVIFYRDEVSCKTRLEIRNRPFMTLEQ